ncbi:MAG TPA: nucleotidyltransferase family protein [Chitinophagaceae bacterium]|nr:nucleotidyltransferase family protein [Chitinophagaceae bacterium]
MNDWKKFTIDGNATVKQALSQLDALGKVGAVLFAVDGSGLLLGSVTDGDIRRGFLGGASLTDPLGKVLHSPCRSLGRDQQTGPEMEKLRRAQIRFVPLVAPGGRILDILDLQARATLPVEVILMAGGKGERLRPLTEEIPKPLLPIGEKPILEHNLDRLARYGFGEVHVSLHYKGQQIRDYFGDGSSRNLQIRYVEETEPLGTVGAVSLLGKLKQEHLLIMNADVLTDIDFADFYAAFLAADADMCVASTLYHVDVPYAVLEAGADNRVTALAEKPTYTYYSNAGIYLVKRSFLDLVPPQVHFDITDLMEKGLSCSKVIIHYPILGYWLDIGRLQDYQKAQQDIKHLKL